jgi:hypothetical protein
MAISGSWGTRSRSAALVDILHEQHRYFVSTADGERSLMIVDTDDGKRLRTEADLMRRDVLQDLPDID